MSDAIDRGITVTEIAAMDQPVDVTPETTAAFVGRTLRGPLNTPVLVRNYGEFRKRFGDAWSRSMLGPAVLDFFEHGGSALYIVRVANKARGAMLCLPAHGSALVLRAVEPGAAETLRVAVDYDRIDRDDRFNLTVQRMDPATGLVVDQEYFAGVSHREDSKHFVADALLSSDMVRVEHPLPTHRPESTVGLEHGVGVDYVEAAQAGDDGAALTDYDVIGSRADSTGLFALDKIEHFDVLYLPPVAPRCDTGPTALLAAELYCRQRGALLIVDPREEWDDAERAVQGLRDYGYASPNMLSYFPRLRDAGSAGASSAVAGGAIAGVLAKLDRMAGPWQSVDRPGLALRRALRPLVELDEEDRQLLEQNGVNTLVADATQRLRVCGNRTLARGTGSCYRQETLAVRRLCLRIVRIVDAATRWAVFEQPGSRLAARVRVRVHAALVSLYELGAFADEGFDVKCRFEPEAPSGPQSVEILLAFTPAGASTPVTLTLHQSAAGCRVTSTAFGPALSQLFAESLPAA